MIRKELEKQMGDVIDFRRSAGVGVPLIVQALRDDVSDTIPAELAESFRQRWMEALALHKQGVFATGATAGTHASHAFSYKLAACVVAGMLAAGGGAMLAAGQFHADGAKAPPLANLAGGELVFEGGDCDCGHVNPDGVNVKDVRLGGGDTYWRVVANKDSQVIYEGAKDGVLRTFAALYDEKENGSYTVYYSHTDEQGNRIQINRGFIIDTRDFPQGIYK
jgi:hypothetical protein